MAQTSRVPKHLTHHDWFTASPCKGCKERRRRVEEVRKASWRIGSQGDYLMLHRYDLGLLARSKTMVESIDWEGIRA